jgi:hypothetical protein
MPHSHSQLLDYTLKTYAFTLADEHTTDILFKQHGLLKHKTNIESMENPDSDIHCHKYLTNFQVLYTAKL